MKNIKTSGDSHLAFFYLSSYASSINANSGLDKEIVKIIN
jgi:hypothetical protein